MTAFYNSPFRFRLMAFISAPQRREFVPLGYEDQFAWTHQQNIAEKRWHRPRQWQYRNSQRTAYAVNMHLLARRYPRRFE